MKQLILLLVLLAACSSTSEKAPAEFQLGTLSNETLANGESGTQGVQTFTFPEELEANQLYLNGTWDFTEEYAESLSEETSVAFEVDANAVHVLASASTAATLEVWVDGAAIETFTVSDKNLYPLAEGLDPGLHSLTIKVKGKGFKAFAFTFD